MTAYFQLAKNCTGLQTFTRACQQSLDKEQQPLPEPPPYPSESEEANLSFHWMQGSSTRDQVSTVYRFRGAQSSLLPYLPHSTKGENSTERMLLERTVLLYVFGY